MRGKTILYGFGLDQLANYPEEENMEGRAAAWSALTAELKYRLAYKMIIYLCECGAKSGK